MIQAHSSFETTRNYHIKSSGLETKKAILGLQALAARYQAKIELVLRLSEVEKPN